MGISVSASLGFIVRPMYLPAYDLQYSGFAMRHLVKQVGQGQKGNQVNISYWNPNTTGVSTLTEGTDITATTSLFNATTSFGATEFGFRTIYTYQDLERANDDIPAEHARQHGMQHGKKLETKLLAQLANLVGTLTATSTTGVTLGTLAKAKTKLEAKTTEVGGPYYYVTHPYAWLTTFNSETQNSNFGVRGDVGNDILNKFVVTTLLGDIQVYQSNHFTISSSQTAGYPVRCGMFVKDAIGLWIERDFTMKSQEDISLRGHEIVSTTKNGCKAVHSDHGVQIVAYCGVPS